MRRPGRTPGSPPVRSALRLVDGSVYNRRMEAFGTPMDARLLDLVDRLQPMMPLKILLFGSSARGEADGLSDIDLIVVAENVAPRFLDRIADAYDLVHPRYALDILIYTPAEYAKMLEDGNSLLETAEKDGRLIYERPAA